VIDLGLASPFGDAARVLEAGAAVLPAVVALAVILTGLGWALGAFHTPEGRLLGLFTVLVAAGLALLMTHAWAQGFMAPGRLVQADLGLGQTLNQILSWRW
jgi:hypothetical protein